MILFDARAVDPRRPDRPANARLIMERTHRPIREPVFIAGRVSEVALVEALVEGGWDRVRRAHREIHFAVTMAGEPFRRVVFEVPGGQTESVRTLIAGGGGA